jgi:sugar-specific transcriptional regulator TrmB
MLVQVLEQLGLSSKESQIYLSLLEIGSQPVSIIAKKAGINRTTCYVILEELAKKGLITNFIKAKIRYFTAANPNSLKDYLEAQTKSLNSKKDILLKNLDAFGKIINKESLRPKVYMLEGINGIIQTYEDTLKEGKTICAIESPEDMSEEVQKYLYGSYVPRRKAAKIFAQALVPNNKSNEEFKKMDKKHFRETRLIKDPNFKIGIEINIYGNKTALIAYQKGEYTSVIIENKPISESMRAVFEILWNQNGKRKSKK